MLSSLYVSDLALIRRLSVDFHRGFSVLTGETGAGKSLVLDSLGLFLESRGAKELVRHGSEKLEVTLFFTDLSPECKNQLSDLLDGEELEEGVTLSRVVSAEGKSICKVGGRPVPFSRLSSVARTLLAIHGQGSAAELLNEKKHLSYLDSALSPEWEQILKEYLALWREYSDAKSNLDHLLSLGDEEDEIALLDFKLSEIRKVAPKKGEEEALEQKLLTLQSYAKSYSSFATAHKALSGGEKGKGAVFLLSAAARSLEKAPETEETKEKIELLYDLSHKAQELERELSFALSSLSEEDPGDMIDRIQKRIQQLYRLKQRFHLSVDEILTLYEELKEKRELTARRKDDIKREKETVKRLLFALTEKGKLLSQEREKVARRLEEEVLSVLSFLDMPKTKFRVLFTPLASPSSAGLEKVAFGIQANTGEGMMPLSQVASGGEMSRIMLALSLKLLKAKDADTLIFDEIDTGISGATAQKIGVCLKILGETKQIFCVTHSAQVATLATQHYLVAKEEKEGRTETSLTLLDEGGSLSENARLLGGATLSEEALFAAKNLRLEGETEWMKLKDTWK